MNFTNNESNSSGLIAEWFAVPRDVSILFLLVLCFGLVANSLSAVVWLRQVTTKSGAFFLGCLSLADMLYCLVLSLLFLIIEQSNKQGCNIYGIVEVILLTAGISRLFTVSVVAQRWVAVSKPVSLEWWCRPTLLGKVVLLTCLLIPIVVIHLLDIHVIELYKSICNQSLFAEEKIKPSLASTYSAQICFYLFSFVCQGVFSCLLLYSACTVEQVLSGSVSRRWRISLEQRMTIIVLCVSAVSMLEFFLSFIFFALLLGIYIQTVNNSTATFFFCCSVVLNSTVNFVIYAVIGKSFRHKLVSLCKSIVGIVRPPYNCGTGRGQGETTIDIALTSGSGHNEKTEVPEIKD